jgi:HlyD family secretion protein
MNSTGTRRLIAVVAITFGLVACEQVVEEPVYQLLPVTTRDIVLSASAAGSIEPVTTVEVKSKASGEIIEVRVEAGDAVSVGDLLVRVDQRVPGNALVQAEADIEVAQAQVDNAASQMRRSQALFETQAITETEYEAARLGEANARAQLIRAQRTLEDARISFEDTEVRARTHGVVLEKNVEVGTVIASASRDVGGGAILLRMANLDTVQVRTLVDETDIGKIGAGLAVTITVDAYPNQPFEGTVLKIEPEALVQQNVTMFPVLIRIGNERGLLRPGMNSEVEIHIGSREGVLAIPNNALRTMRDIESAAAVLGLDMATVQDQLALARGEGSDARRDVAMGEQGDDSSPQTITMRGREVELPSGVSPEQIEAIQAKARSEGRESLTEDERALLGRVMRSAFGGEGGPGARAGNGAGPGRRGQPQATQSPRPQSSFDFTGDYLVFTMRNGVPTATPVRTGLTDLDYSEVLSGLTEADTILVLTGAVGQDAPGAGERPQAAR